MRPLKLIENINQKIIVAGKVLYSDQRRRIHIKKPIRNLFENNLNDVNYIMELCLSESRLVQRIKELEEKNVQPILLYFTEEDKE